MAGADRNHKQPPDKFEDEKPLLSHPLLCQPLSDSKAVCTFVSHVVFNMQTVLNNLQGILGEIDILTEHIDDVTNRQPIGTIERQKTHQVQPKSTCQYPHESQNRTPEIINGCNSNDSSPGDLKPGSNYYDNRQKINSTSQRGSSKISNSKLQERFRIPSITTHSDWYKPFEHKITSALKRNEKLSKRVGQTAQTSSVAIVHPTVINNILVTNSHSTAAETNQKSTVSTEPGIARNIRNQTREQTCGIKHTGARDSETNQQPNKTSRNYKKEVIRDKRCTTLHSSNAFLKTNSSSQGSKLLPTKFSVNVDRRSLVRPKPLDCISQFELVSTIAGPKNNWLTTAIDQDTALESDHYDDVFLETPSDSFDTNADEDELHNLDKIITDQKQDKVTSTGVSCSVMYIPKVTEIIEHVPRVQEVNSLVPAASSDDLPSLSESFLYQTASLPQEDSYLRLEEHCDYYETLLDSVLEDELDFIVVEDKNEEIKDGRAFGDEINVSRNKQSFENFSSESIHKSQIPHLKQEFLSNNLSTQQLAVNSKLENITASNRQDFENVPSGKSNTSCMTKPTHVITTDRSFRLPQSNDSNGEIQEKQTPSKHGAEPRLNDHNRVMNPGDKEDCQNHGPARQLVSAKDVVSASNKFWNPDLSNWHTKPIVHQAVTLGTKAAPASSPSHLRGSLASLNDDNASEVSVSSIEATNTSLDGENLDTCTDTDDWTTSQDEAGSTSSGTFSHASLVIHKARLRRLRRQFFHSLYKSSDSGADGNQLI